MAFGAMDFCTADFYEHARSGHARHWEPFPVRAFVRAFHFAHGAKQAP